MTTHYRCDPPFPVVTSRGKGWAHWMIDRTQDHNLEWVVVQDDTGECWTYQNPEVRFQVNETMGRYVTSSIQSAGGRARADKLTPERRKEIARAAAQKRWDATRCTSGRTLP